MVAPGGINLLRNLVFFGLVNFDKSLMSVDPMSVVGTSARFVFHYHNLLSSLAAGFYDRLKLSDLSIVNLDLLVQISVDSNSNSVICSDQVSLLAFDALDSNFENL